ncbi:MAG: thioredoxin [Actinomycetota bacterium]
MDQRSFGERVLEAERPVVVDFYADWCGPCHQMSPVLERLAEELGDEIEFVKLDIDASPDVASAYRVSSIPSIVRFDDGRPTRRSVGVRSGATLSRELRLGLSPNTDVLERRGPFGRIG